MMLGDVYPIGRPKFFACKFGRLLTKSAAAMTIGADACWLLTVVALQEDAISYKRPVTYWNEQLQTLCGFGSRKRLVNARAKAIDAGWLVYSSGDKTKPGSYFVKLPDALSITDDGPCHEDDLADSDGGTKRNGKSAMGVRNGTASGTANLFGGNESERQRGAMRNGKGAPFIPNPKPITCPDSAESDVTKKSPKQEAKYSESDHATAAHIWAAIQAMQPSRKKPNLKSWANDVRLMRERDNRTDEQIRNVFNAANKDSFWRTNILSTSNLRKRFDDLELKLCLATAADTARRIV